MISTPDEAYFKCEMFVIMECLEHVLETHFILRKEK